MNDAEEQLAERLAIDLERVLGTGILIEDLEIQGEGPVTINVACLVDGRSREIHAEGESAIDAMSNVIRLAAELRLAGAFWQMVGSGLQGAHRPASGASRCCMELGGRPALAADPLQQGDNAAVRRSDDNARGDRTKEERMSLRGRLSLLGAAAVLVAACSSGGATAAPSAGAGSGDTPIAGGLLDKVMKAGKIVMSTDPQYPPQSSLKADGTYEGFDIDVGTEIAKRLGVDIAFETPDFALVSAGNWSDRWDFSVGSDDHHHARARRSSTSRKPYYYTPAQMATSHRPRLQQPG